MFFHDFTSFDALPVKNRAGYEPQPVVYVSPCLLFVFQRNILVLPVVYTYRGDFSPRTPAACLPPVRTPQEDSAGFMPASSILLVFISHSCSFQRWLCDRICRSLCYRGWITIARYDDLRLSALRAETARSSIDRSLFRRRFFGYRTDGPPFDEM